MKTFALCLCLTALAAVPRALAVQYFQYDKASEVIHSTALENPLFYDGSVLAVDGKTCVAWLEFQPSKRDVVWFGIRDNSGKWTEKKQITPISADCANPTLTRDKAGQIWLTYETVNENKWAIFAVARNTEGTFSAPFRISADSDTCVSHHVTAAPDGGIWVVWQADNNGQFDIFARQIQKAESPVERPFQISDSPRGDWHPSITATPNGDIYVAWDSYDGTAYNIRTREFHNAAWSKIMDVTASPDFNANPDITADQNGRVWLAWEEDGPNWGRPYHARTNGKVNSTKMSDDIGSVHRFRQLHIAELLNENTTIRDINFPQPSFALAAARENAPAGIKKLGVFYQSPQLTTDGQNRLWLVYRHFYMPLMGITLNHHMQNDWGIYARCLDHGVWSKVYRFDHGQGDALQRIFASGTKDGIAVAYTFGRTDRRNPQNYVEDALAPDKVVAHVSKKRKPSGDEETDDDKAPKKAKNGRNRNQPKDDDHPLPSDGRGVVLASISLKESSKAKPESSNSDRALQPEDLSKIPAKPARPGFDLNGKHYELYFGDFHRHTDISLCFWPGDGTMDDAYRYGIDAAPLDFLGVTDHTHDIAMGDPLSLMWQRIRKEVNRHALAGKFIPFYSYERSRGDTDHNVISLRDDMLRPHTYPHSEFWRELDTNTFTIPHQPFNSVLWKTNDRVHRPLMEIYQGFRDHTCESDATNGLASGNEVGFICSSDHLSTGTSFAGLWADEPTRTNLFRSLQARRTFGAMDQIVLAVTCDNHWMGEKFEVHDTPTIKIFAHPVKGKLTKLEAYVDGIPRELPLNPTAVDQYEYRPDTTLKGRHTVFIRVTESTGNFAWSSPMWITFNGTEKL